MTDDDMVTLEVQMPENWVREHAEMGYNPDIRAAARRWVAEHDRPERRVYGFGAFDAAGDHYAGAGRAVAVEDLWPGDRVAGREVVSNIPGEHRGRLVQFDGDGPAAFYPPGTLVVLDLEGDR